MWDSAPQSHSRVSNINFDIWGTLYISDEKIPKDGKVLSHSGFRSNVLYGPSTDLSKWVGFCTSRPQQVVKYQLWYLDFLWGEVYKYPIVKRLQSSFPLGFKSKVLSQPLTDLRALVVFCTSHPHQGVKYQIWCLDFFWREPYKYSMKIANGRKSSFPLGGLNQRFSPVLKWFDVKVLQGNVMLWDMPCSKNRNFIPGISVFIGHASRPP